LLNAASVAGQTGAINRGRHCIPRPSRGRSSQREPSNIQNAPEQSGAQRSAQKASQSRMVADFNGIGFATRGRPAKA
jgi:hypothetical protein